MNTDISFKLNDNMKLKIAQLMGLPLEEVPDDDYVNFVKSALESSFA